MKKLLTIALAGLIYVLPTQEGYLFIGRDTNKDNVEDTRDVYQLKGLADNGYMVYEKIKTFKDLNKDGIFTEDEVIWTKGDLKI